MQTPDNNSKDGPSNEPDAFARGQALGKSIASDIGDSLSKSAAVQRTGSAIGLCFEDGIVPAMGVALLINVPWGCQLLVKGQWGNRIFGAILGFILESVIFAFIIGAVKRIFFKTDESSVQKTVEPALSKKLDYAAMGAFLIAAVVAFATSGVGVGILTTISAGLMVFVIRLFAGEVLKR